MEHDFAAELRGEPESEEPMNVKESGMVPAIVVGVILTITNVWMSRSMSRDDSTVAALAELKVQVFALSEQIKEIKGLPYVRREESNSVHAAFENRLSGLEKRVDELGGRFQRSEVQRRNP